MIAGVPLIRLMVVLLAGVAVVAGYIHESRRLQVIRQLTGDKARDYYEAGRARGEGMMWAITLALVVAAAVFAFADLAFLRS